MYTVNMTEVKGREDGKVSQVLDFCWILDLKYYLSQPL